MFGLVRSPRFVGWLLSYRGWEAACADNDRKTVSRILLQRYGYEATTCILRMGEQPVEVPRRER